MSEIRLYADALGILPGTVLQRAGGYGGTVWAKWEAGTTSCSFRKAAQIKKYIHDNPASDKNLDAA